MAAAQLLNNISSRKKIFIPNKRFSSISVHDFTKYSLTHESNGGTILKIYSKSKDDVQNSIYLNVSHLPILENLSQYYSVKSIDKEMFAYILHQGNQQGNIYADENGRLLLEPYQGKQVQISKDDLIKICTDIEIDINGNRGVLITL